MKGEKQLLKFFPILLGALVSVPFCGTYKSAAAVAFTSLFLASYQIQREPVCYVRVGFLFAGSFVAMLCGISEMSVLLGMCACAEAALPLLDDKIKKATLVVLGLWSFTVKANDLIFTFAPSMFVLLAELGVICGLIFLSCLKGRTCKIRLKAKQQKEETQKQQKEEKNRFVTEISQAIEKKKKVTLSDLSALWLEEKKEVQKSASSRKNSKTEEEQSKKLEREEVEEKQQPGSKQEEEQIAPAPEVEAREEVKSRADSVPEETPLEAEEKSQQEKTADEEEEAEQVQFKNELVKEIYSFLADITSQEIRSVIVCLLKYLDEVSDAPSVSLADSGNELPETSYQLLSKVTLAEHTLNVCKQMKHILQDRYRDTWQATWPHSLLVAIAHDLGKAEKSEDGEMLFYGEHAQRSAEILGRCAGDLKEADALRDVVAFHHGNVPEIKHKNLLFLLKEADKAARRKELEGLAGEMLSWKQIDVKELCAFICERLKEIAKKGDFRSCVFYPASREGVIFILLGIFTSSVQEFCRQKGVFWPEIFSKNESEIVQAYVRFFREVLSPANLLPSGSHSLPAGGYYRFYPVHVGRRNMGTRPYVVFILSTFCSFAGISLHEFVKEFNESALSQIRVGTA